MKHHTQVVLRLGFILSTCVELQSAPAASVKQTSPDGAAFFIATNGNDKWSGQLPAPNARKTDGPFATLPQAVQAVRDSNHHARSNDRPTIYVRGGRHLLSEPLVLTPEDAGLQIAAFKNEQPILSGGVRIAGWHEVV